MKKLALNVYLVVGDRSNNVYVLSHPANPQYLIRDNE